MQVPIRPHTCPIVFCFCMQGISTSSLPIDAQERPNLAARKSHPVALESRSKSALKPPGDAVRGHVLCWLLGLVRTHLCQAHSNVTHDTPLTFSPSEDADVKGAALHQCYWPF